MIKKQDAWSAAFYDCAEHDPTHSYVALSYMVFKREIVRQWNDLCEAGLKFIPNIDDPYSNSAQMFEDVQINGTLRVFADNGATLPDDHPLKEEIPFRIKGFEVYNDLFRAVHDVMGHVASGGQFGPIGEEQAWRAHCKTLSRIAHNALWCDTRGQNAWTNFSNHHADMPISERPFPEQKATLVPQFLLS